ncbi:MAG: 3-oxoacyl-ACP reductase family protein [Bacteroidota bacterium]
MSTLSDRVALVTGGSRGIGAATAKRLAADGATVAISYNSSPDRAEAVVAEIREAGGTAEAFQADAASAEASATLVHDVLERFGRLDVLVNNAGVYQTNPIAETTDDQFDANLDVNVRGPFATVRAAAERLGEGGRIVNIGSVVANRGFPGNSVYGASKAAVEAMTRAWAREFGARGITVNTVHPGPIDTEMNPADPDQNPGAAFMAGATALGRYGTAEEIADTVAFLVSDRAGYITGAAIPVDGGLTA